MKRRELILVLGFLLAAVAVFLLPRFVSDFRAQQFAYVGIYFIALLCLNLLTGITGQISLGHGAFMLIGGYTTAILMADHGVKDIYLAATHGVFAPPALERLSACDYTKLAVTDTIPIGDRADAIKDRLVVLSVASFVPSPLKARLITMFG